MEKHLPFVGFAAAALWVLIATLRFNLRTATIVRSIQALLEEEGRHWQFWTDKNLLQIFIFQPHRLVLGSDSPAVREAKVRLVEHRSTLARWLFVSIVVAVVLVLASLAGAVAIAFFETH